MLKLPDHLYICLNTNLHKNESDVKQDEDMQRYGRYQPEKKSNIDYKMFTASMLDIPQNLITEQNGVLINPLEKLELSKINARPAKYLKTFPDIVRMQFVNNKYFTDFAGDPFKNKNIYINENDGSVAQVNFKNIIVMFVTANSDPIKIEYERKGNKYIHNQSVASIENKGTRLVIKEANKKNIIFISKDLYLFKKNVTNNIILNNIKLTLETILRQNSILKIDGKKYVIYNSKILPEKWKLIASKNILEFCDKPLDLSKFTNEIKEFKQRLSEVGASTSKKITAIIFRKQFKKFIENLKFIAESQSGYEKYAKYFTRLYDSYEYCFLNNIPINDQNTDEFLIQFPTSVAKVVSTKNTKPVSTYYTSALEKTLRGFFNEYKEKIVYLISRAMMHDITEEKKESELPENNLLSQALVDNNKNLELYSNKHVKPSIKKSNKTLKKVGFAEEANQVIEIENKKEFKEEEVADDFDNDMKRISLITYDKTENTIFNALSNALDTDENDIMQQIDKENKRGRNSSAIRDDTLTSRQISLTSISDIINKIYSCSIVFVKISILNKNISICNFSKKTFKYYIFICYDVDNKEFYLMNIGGDIKFTKEDPVSDIFLTCLYSMFVSVELNPERRLPFDTSSSAPKSFLYSNEPTNFQTLLIRKQEKKTKKESYDELSNQIAKYSVKFKELYDKIYCAGSTSDTHERHLIFSSSSSNIGDINITYEIFVDADRDTDRDRDRDRERDRWLNIGNRFEDRSQTSNVMKLAFFIQVDLELKEWTKDETLAKQNCNMYLTNIKKDSAELLLDSLSLLGFKPDEKTKKKNNMYKEIDTHIKQKLEAEKREKESFNREREPRKKEVAFMGGKTKIRRKTRRKREMKKRGAKTRRRLFK
jgi:hypothetical protein